MQIKELFKKDIFRAINGVIKAEQKDEASIRQELDELVLTKELTGHLDHFFSVYADTIDNPKDSDAAGKIGVWVSGFFGSGKSHFIKALYYLFNNTTVQENGQPKCALQFFEEKITDAMLAGTIKRVVGKDNDAILFNIDSKADQKSGRDAILGVFLKVLNELQGYSPDYPHIAHMERYLDKKGKLGDFKREYRALTRESWEDRRLDWQFNQDPIVKALSGVLGQSEQSGHRWIDSAETDFSLTVENFARWVKEYLDTRSPSHRILFFVDEVGQFIGKDGHLMLNLQTIVENLGVVCNGRAWVIVTSQEDIDTVLGSLSNARTNDFSKIQGRFKTRLSLSSSNTDEVIKKRLLEKKDENKDPLRKLYLTNADILKNQLTFTSDTGMSLPSYASPEEFINSYPFIPYQFKLLQKVFETIRRAGVTGLHLSRGERSMLDAFQFASQKAAIKDVGILVSLYSFFPSIESFFDTVVKRTIDQASQNMTLHEFDISVLKVLFMIRYVSEIKGNIDNLVTLCIENIDEDRLILRKKINESVLRLEKQSLIACSGENYYFLTNEEQDISREIKNVELSSGDESRALSKIIFEDVYRDERKHRYAKTGKDFDLLRMCDLQVCGGNIEKGLAISIFSTFYAEYEYLGQPRCIGESTKDGGCIIFKLKDDDGLNKDLIMLLKTDKYIARKNESNPEVKRILEERKAENRLRKTRIILFVKELLAQAEIFINGQIWTNGSDDPQIIRGRALDYLLENTFSKMDYIEHPCANPQIEIGPLLRYDDMTQRVFDLNLAENNPRAVKEIREYISLCALQSRQMIVDEIVERFATRPYGWNEWETVLMIVKLFCRGEIQFVYSGGVLERTRLNDVISRTSNWKKITLRQRKVIDLVLIEKVRKIGQLIFGEMGPDKELPLYEFLKQKFIDWIDTIRRYKTIAETGKYPGLLEINQMVRLVETILNTQDSFELLTLILEKENELKAAADIYFEINEFYTLQLPQWDSLRSAKSTFGVNRFDLDKNMDFKAALSRIDEILNAPAPYSIIREAGTLIHKVEEGNNSLLIGARNKIKEIVTGLVEKLEKEARSIKVSETNIEQSKVTLSAITQRSKTEWSIANINRLEEEAGRVFEIELNCLAKTVELEPDKPEVKELQTIRVRNEVQKPYLETDSDVDEFIGDLNKKLKTAIRNGKRIRVE